ncbi:hypothetical protein BU17DRAFT_91228 [Hysterangium stoloniferum]|nr:hypothetical protein BU17DRAFT_91228 [Hysterangium stoloniferum]
MVIINCLLVGDDEPFQHIFDVQTSPDETISKLREKILEKDAKLHSRMSAGDLMLYIPKQKISTYSKDIFNAIFTQLMLDTPEGWNSVLSKLNPTFTVEEAGLSEPARHQLHVLVVVSPDRITLSDSSNSRLSNILMGEPPAKRLCMEGSVVSDEYVGHIPSEILPKMLEYCRFWGSPLDLSLTTLSDQVNTTIRECEEQPNGDVLPDEPFIPDTDTFAPRLVRAEYIRIIDAVKVAYETSHNTSFAVVTGQPGIGKTSWISYALRYCLGEKQPVVWYRFANCYFFSGSGVVIINPLDHRCSGKHTWCFVDSMDARETLPHKICSPAIELFPVYVTSPKESRWRKLHQSGRIPQLIVMNPWTLDELKKAAELYPNRELEDIRERYHNAGPSARLCLTFSSVLIKLG